jgi:hypothetical protein
MTWSRLASTLLIVALAPAVAWARAEPDPHVALRARAGLPASSAVGEVRIFSEAYLSGGGAESVVAHRSKSGRWTVSLVQRSAYGRTRNPVQGWRLTTDDARELEALLEDPDAVAAEPESNDPCLDPPSSELDVRWRGREDHVYATCQLGEGFSRISAILTRGRR